jgi:hypothetical protein
VGGGVCSGGGAFGRGLLSEAAPRKRGSIELLGVGEGDGGRWMWSPVVERLKVDAAQDERDGGLL